MKADAKYIWINYHKVIRRYLSKYINCPDDLEDIVNETMLKVHLGIDGLRDKRKLDSWLIKVAKNCVIDFYKKRQSHSSPFNNENNIHSDDYDFYKELSPCLPFLISRLPSELSKIIFYVDILCQSQKEYSELSGIKYSTLKSRVHKSRETLYVMILDCCYLIRNEDGKITGYERKVKQCCKPNCY